MVENGLSLSFRARLSVPTDPVGGSLEWVKHLPMQSEKRTEHIFLFCLSKKVKILGRSFYKMNDDYL